MTAKYVYLDYEFRNSQNRFLDIVSVSYSTNTGKEDTIWLYEDEKAQEKHAAQIVKFHQQGYIFVAYAVTAEARCFETLLSKFGYSLNVWDFRWIDLYLEWRMLLNHNNRFTKGRHLVKGRVVTIHENKKWRSDVKSYQAEYNMGAACYKLLGEKIDTKRKTEVRDIIIAGDYLESFSREILEYNKSDIEYLPRMFEAVLKAYQDELEERDFIAMKEVAMFKRGDYAARTAKMEATGYPIDYEATKSFSESVPSILFQLQMEINSLFPEIKPFRLDMKKGKFTWNQIATRAWVSNSEHRHKWRQTDGGDYSLSLDAFSDHFAARHEFPEDCFGSQMKRYLTFKRNLNGFLPPKKGVSNFWDFVGSDKRVRPYMGIYSSQSSRSQPSAKGFLFLKSAWMRSLCKPADGRAITSIDYKSEEFLLGAMLANDKKMIEAYDSGDPYVWFAKACDAIPPEGDKDTHPKVRGAFKSTVLALQYMMGDESLAKKLSADTGSKWTKNQAAKQSKMFNRTFEDFKYYREDFVYDGQSTYQIAWDGWILFKDNPNPLSIGNWPVQTCGAVIMREAVRLAQDKGLQIIFTLHDALYVEHDCNDYDSSRILAECMQKAFQIVMNTDKTIGLDIDVWSPNYEGKFEEIKQEYFSHGVDTSVKGKYIDPRGKKEYEIFKQYFTNELSEV